MLKNSINRTDFPEFDSIIVTHLDPEKTREVIPLRHKFLAVRVLSKLTSDGYIIKPEFRSPSSTWKPIIKGAEVIQCKLPYRRIAGVDVTQNKVKKICKAFIDWLQQWADANRLRIRFVKKPDGA